MDSIKALIQQSFREDEDAIAVVDCAFDVLLSEVDEDKDEVTAYTFKQLSLQRTENERILSAFQLDRESVIVLLMPVAVLLWSDWLEVLCIHVVGCYMLNQRVLFSSNR